eukprot:scpid66469/ scgid7101/ 
MAFCDFGTRHAVRGHGPLLLLLLIPTSCLLAALVVDIHTRDDRPPSTASITEDRIREGRSGRCFVASGNSSTSPWSQRQTTMSERNGNVLVHLTLGSSQESRGNTFIVKQNGKTLYAASRRLRVRSHTQHTFRCGQGHTGRQLRSGECQLLPAWTSVGPRDQYEWLLSVFTATLGRCLSTVLGIVVQLLVVVMLQTLCTRLLDDLCCE